MQLFENDEYVLGNVKDVEKFFKDEIIDYYIYNVGLDDVDGDHLKSMVQAYSRLMELSNSDEDYIVKVEYGHCYKIEIMVAIQSETY